MAVCSSTMSLFFVILMGFMCSSHANNYTLYVGGNDGWTLKPKESYSHWAQRYRFQINDQLVFKYKKGKDSVLVVSEDDYSKCNKQDPIKSLKDGDSRLKLDRSGPFFFISGHHHNCEKGQKIIIVVLSNNHHNTTHRPPSVPPVPPPSHSPAHSSASDFGGSFVLIVGLSLLEAVISARIV